MGMKYISRFISGVPHSMFERIIEYQRPPNSPLIFYATYSNFCFRGNEEPNMDTKPHVRYSNMWLKSGAGCDRKNANLEKVPQQISSHVLNLLIEPKHKT